MLFRSGLCLKKARLAVGKKSALSDRELIAIAMVAWDSELIIKDSWRFQGVPEGADHPGPWMSCPRLSSRFAWAFRLSADCAFKALGAAMREAKRIRKTTSWMTAEVIRGMCIKEAFRKRWFARAPSRFDIQTIREEVRKRFKISVEDKLIHKVLRGERVAQERCRDMQGALDHTDWPESELRMALEIGRAHV